MDGSVVDAESGIDDGLNQCGAVDPGGVVDDASLTRSQRDGGALHTGQSSQNLVNAIDAATAGHTGHGQDDFVHCVPQKNF